MRERRRRHSRRTYNDNPGDSYRATPDDTCRMPPARAQSDREGRSPRQKRQGLGLKVCASLLSPLRLPSVPAGAFGMNAPAASAVARPCRRVPASPLIGRGCSREGSKTRASNSATTTTDSRRPSRSAAAFARSMLDIKQALERNNAKQSGNGKTAMVFAHGFGCDQNMWRFVAPAFVSPKAFQQPASLTVSQIDEPCYGADS